MCPVIDPVTISLNLKLPLLLSEGLPIVIVGLDVYPAPAFVILIAVMVPAELTTASAVARVFAAPTGAVIVTVGAVVYPEPASVSVTIPTAPSPIKTVPAAPEPPPPVIWSVGATVYPEPGLVITTAVLILDYH